MDYRQGAKVGDVVEPEDLPSRRVDDEPDASAARVKGQGEAARNVNAANPQDAALESPRKGSSREKA